MAGANPSKFKPKQVVGHKWNNWRALTKKVINCHILKKKAGYGLYHASRKMSDGFKIFITEQRPKTENFY